MKHGFAAGCFLALVLATQVDAAGDCIKDQYGNVVCGKGQCATDQYGKVLCAKEGGGAIREPNMAMSSAAWAIALWMMKGNRSARHNRAAARLLTRMAK